MPFNAAFHHWTNTASPRELIVASNVTTIPAHLSSPATPAIQVDGLWGPFEWTRLPQPYDATSPYLPYIRIPNPSNRKDILTRPMAKVMMINHPTRQGFHTMESEVASALKSVLDWASTMATKNFAAIRQNLAYKSVSVPQIALDRARTCYYGLEEGVQGWNEFTDYFRNAQRALLELDAFSRWWEDAKAGDQNRWFTPSASPPTRGAFFPTIPLFEYYARLNIAAYMIIPSGSLPNPPPVRYLPATSRSAYCTTDNPRNTGVQKHSKPLWFYPPQVHDIESFEAAARGIAPRDDVLRPTAHYAAILKKEENKKKAREQLRKSEHLLLITSRLNTDRLSQRLNRQQQSPTTFGTGSTVVSMIPSQHHLMCARLSNSTCMPWHTLTPTSCRR